MIRLSKTAVPQILVEQGDTWREDFQNALAEGAPTPTVRFRYRHPDIKNALRSETNEKCAYCESKVSHVSPGDTEHIEPVSKFPHLVVEWGNLTYVCEECNRRKSDYSSTTEPLINPYLEDPRAHVRFAGPMTTHFTDKGFRTRKKLGLCRPALIERRKDRLDRILTLVDRWKALAEGTTKSLIREELLAEAAPDKEFSACVRDFLSVMRVDQTP